MTPADRAAAQAALNEGRGVYGRLDQIRGPEDAAADLVELWGTAESAMRAMLGGSTLGGQALVRELRQRGMLNLEQANALASFWDAKARTDDVGYKPTLTDVGYARSGYNELARAITEAPATPVASGSFAPPGTAGAGTPAVGPAAAAATAGAAAVAPNVPPARPASAPVRPVVAGRRSPLMMIGLIVLVLAVLGAAAYFVRSRGSYDSAMASAIDLMQTGRNEGARAAFTQIVNDHPEQGRPHVFLSRLARMDGDVNTARTELVTAIRLDTNDELAQREMGVFQLSQNNPDLARNFLVRAVTMNKADSAAQGYLGCALYRLNRVEEAQRFFAHAGNGSWSSCTTTPVGLPPAAATPITH